MKKILLFLLLCFPAHNTLSSWVTLSSGTSADLRSVCFVNTSTGFATGESGVLLKTTNSGTIWSTVASGLSTDINSITFLNSTTGFACGFGGNIIRTTNGGLNWSAIPSGVTDNLFSISFSGNNGVCSGGEGTILTTSNSGANWVIVSNGFFSTNYYGCHMSSSSNAHVCGVNAIFQPLVGRTTNSGANWSYSTFYLNTNEGNLRDIHFINSAVGFTAANVWDGQGGISYTTNGGVNWTTQLVDEALNGLDFTSDATGYAVGLNGYITKTTNKGVTWVEQVSGSSAILRSVDFIDSLTGFAVGDGGVILKTTNGGLTSLQQVNTCIPHKYILGQNYPNPFNPVTSIQFQIPTSNFVKLKIFDALGREVNELISEELSAGTYQIQWDASGEPSGVYYYRLSAGDFSQTQKMILIK